MKHNIWLFILFFTSMVALSSQTKPLVESLNAISKRSSPIRLRSFIVFPNDLWALRRIYGLKLFLKDEVEKKKLEIENKKMLKEVNERKRLFQFYLGARHQGSSFHRDFFSNRIKRDT